MSGVDLRDVFIPHGQGCEATVFSPDDWAVACGNPATNVASAEGQRRYVCSWHYRGWYRDAGPQTVEPSAGPPAHTQERQA